MAVTSVYPVLMSADVPSAVAFYRDVFGFESTFECDWYVSLRLGGFELALLVYDHETIPAVNRALPQGLLINIEVDGVDTIYQHVIDAGLTPVLPLRDEAFGQRHFILEGPDGVLVDVIQPIEPDESFAVNYIARD